MGMNTHGCGQGIIIVYILICRIFLLHLMHVIVAFVCFPNSLSYMLMFDNAYTVCLALHFC